MPKMYVIGEERILDTRKYDGEHKVSLTQIGTEKFARFPLRRWAQFFRSMHVVDESLDALRKGEAVNLQHHVGGKWYVSVTTGFKCVDVRKFYWHPVMGLKPTREGIALRLAEWEKLKEAVQQMHADHEKIYDVTPCSD